MGAIHFSRLLLVFYLGCFLVQSNPIESNEEHSRVERSVFQRFGLFTDVEVFENGFLNGIVHLGMLLFSILMAHSGGISVFDGQKYSDQK